MPRSWITLPNVGFGLASALLVGSAGLSYRNGQTVAESAENRANAFKTLDQLQACLATFVDIETGARGYVITGDPKFLEPYVAGTARMTSQLQRLAAAFTNDPRQQQLLAALDEAATQFRDRARLVVTLKADHDDGSAERAVGTGAGKRTMDLIRDLIATSIAVEREELGRREEQFQAGLQWRVHIVIAGSLVGFAAVGFAAASINRSLRQRTRINADLSIAIAENVRGIERLRATGVELTRSNEDLEQFAYVASHDLQEPLRKISSFSQLLARQYKGKLDAEADEFIGYMVDGAQRMQTLIQSLLTYSRLGRKNKPFGPVDGTAAVTQSLKNLQTAIEESGAAVTSGVLPTVLADEVQLVQVFQNLIGNAIKFHGAAKPLIQIRAEPADGEWVFSVQDNGIGIDPQFADRIFVIFQRLHSREEYPGTGIGLSLCKKIVERHGGRIWMDSRPGQGTTFCFTLPKARDPERPIQRRATDPLNRVKQPSRDGSALALRRE